MKTKTDHNPLLFLPKQIQDGGYFQIVGQRIYDFDSQHAVCVFRSKFDSRYIFSACKYVP